MSILMLFRNFSTLNSNYSGDEPANATHCYSESKEHLEKLEMSRTGSLESVLYCNPRKQG